MSAGEKPDSPTVRAALEYLRRFRPEELRKTYAIALQTMVFAAAEPAIDQLRITGERRVAGEGSNPPGGFGHMAGIVDL